MESDKNHIKEGGRSRANAAQQNLDFSAQSETLLPPPLFAGSQEKSVESKSKEEDHEVNVELDHSTSEVEESMASEQVQFTEPIDIVSPISIQKKEDEDAELEEQEIQMKSFSDAPSDLPNEEGNSGSGADPPSDPSENPSENNGENTPLQKQEGNSVSSQTSNSGISPDLMGKMENTIGHDFSNVNIHTDSTKASDVGALAYTQGTDLHFAPGQFNPTSTSGQELIGHELTHVKQQAEGRVKPTTTASNGMAVNDDKGLEAEADSLGAKAAGSSAPVQKKEDTAHSSVRSPSVSIIQKYEDNERIPFNEDGTWNGEQIINNLGQHSSGSFDSQASSCAEAATLAAYILEGPSATAEYLELLVTQMEDENSPTELQSEQPEILTGVVNAIRGGGDNSNPLFYFDLSQAIECIYDFFVQRTYNNSPTTGTSGGQIQDIAGDDVEGNPLEFDEENTSNQVAASSYIELEDVIARANGLTQGQRMMVFIKTIQFSASVRTRPSDLTRIRRNTVRNTNAGGHYVLIYRAESGEIALYDSEREIANNDFWDFMDEIVSSLSDIANPDADQNTPTDTPSSRHIRDSQHVYTPQSAVEERLGSWRDGRYSGTTNTYGYFLINGVFDRPEEITETEPTQGKFVSTGQTYSNTSTVSPIQYFRGSSSGGEVTEERNEEAYNSARSYIEGIDNLEDANRELQVLRSASDGVRPSPMISYEVEFRGLPYQILYLLQNYYELIVNQLITKIQSLQSQNPYQEGLNQSPEEEFEQRRALSLSAAGIQSGFDAMYGRMMASAINQSHITYQTYLQLGSSPNIAAPLFDELTHAIYDDGRDRLIEAAVGEGALTRFISFSPLLQGMTMLHEESQWNQRDDDARRTYRTRCIFNYLLIQYAQTVADQDPERNAGQVIAVLNDQVKRYEGWMQEEEPGLNAWARENLPPETQQPNIGPAQQKSEGSRNFSYNSQIVESNPNIIQKMEASFGTSFSDVKIHENSTEAKDVGALAFAQGSDVHFAPGQFKPDTKEGQELIGHELTHVVQQRQGRVKPTAQLKSGMDVNDDPGLEKEADEMGAKAANHKRPQLSTSNSSQLDSSKTVQRKVIQKGGGDEDAPTYNADTTHAIVTYSLQGARFQLRENTQFVEGDKMPQGVKIILRRYVGAQYNEGDEVELLVFLHQQIPQLTFSGYEGSASGGESMIDFMISPDVTLAILNWLENVRSFQGVRITQEQRELLSFGFYGTSAFRDLHAAEVIDSIGLFPPEVDQGMFLDQIARRRPLLTAYIASLNAYQEDRSEENKQAVIQVLSQISDVFVLPHMVLDELRACESIKDHTGYTMLFGAQQTEEGENEDPVTNPPSAETIRGNIARFYSWQPTQPQMSSKIAMGEASHDEMRDFLARYVTYVRNTIGIRDSQGDQELTDSPSRATAPPLPSNMISSPALVAPLFSAAIETDIAFIMRVNFPDFFEAFATPVAYEWEKIKIDPENRGQNVDDLEGVEPDMGDVAASRYARTARYNDTDIRRVWNDVSSELGVVSGLGAATLVQANNIMRYVGTSAGLIFDLVMDPRNLQRITFETAGFYMIRCVATPQYESDEERSIMRPPSVAYLPVYARERGEMARLALEASQQRNESNRQRIDEIRELLSDQCPEDEDALLEELNLLEIGTGSISGIYEQELITINRRIGEIRSRMGEATYLSDEYRALRNRKEDLIRMLGHSRDRQEEHNFLTAERIPATFVSDLGQTVHLQVEVINESVDGSDEKTYYISDLTTRGSGQITRSGSTKAEAISTGLRDLLSSISGYGRGDLRIVVDGVMLDTIRIEADAGQLLMEAIDNIVMTASMVAMAAAPFTGGASLQILIPIGVIGAGTSMYRLMHRSEMGTLHYDLNFAMEIVNIASALIPGVAGVAGVANHFMVQGSLVIMDGVNLMLVGIETIHAIQNLDPSMPIELRNAQVARILGNAGMQFGMTALGNVMGELATHFEANSNTHSRTDGDANPHPDAENSSRLDPDVDGSLGESSTTTPREDANSQPDHIPQDDSARSNSNSGTDLATPEQSLPARNENAEAFLEQNQIRLLAREDAAVFEFLNAAGSWREAMTILGAKPETRYRSIEQNILANRERICQQLNYEFDASPVSGASSQAISDVDLNISGENAGVKLIAAENYMRARFGEAWSALLRMNFYTEASRLTQYESIHSLMTPEQFGNFQAEITVISEQFNYAKMLQHAEGNPQQIASVHEMMSHVSPEVRARAEELASRPRETQTETRNALLLEIDNLVQDFNRARQANNESEMVRLGQEITRKQVECNYLTDEAYIGPGAGRMVVNGVQVRGHEAYQAAISQLEMIHHIIHESGGLVPALREYEIYKYLHRLCESIRVSEHDTMYDRMSRMIYREERGYMQMHDNISDQHLVDFYGEIMDYAQVGIRDLRTRSHQDSSSWTAPSASSRPIVEHPGEITRDSSNADSYVVRESHGDTLNMGGVNQPQARYFANMTIDADGFIHSDVMLVRNDIPGHEGEQRRSVMNLSNLMRDAITHFETNHTVNGIKGDWGSGTNLEVFNAEYRKLIEVGILHDEALITAALLTPTGRTAARFGYRHPIFGNLSRGEGENFTSVQVTFQTNQASQANNSQSPVQQKSRRNISKEVNSNQSSISENNYPSQFKVTQIPSNIDIHENSAKASEMNALAFTQGSDIHFAPGQFKPDTRGGQELIGHELAHVQQQKEGRVHPTTHSNGLPVNDDKNLEKEADDFGVAFAQSLRNSASPEAENKSAQQFKLDNTGSIQRKVSSSPEVKPFSIQRKQSQTIENRGFEIADFGKEKLGQLRAIKQEEGDEKAFKL